MSQVSETTRNQSPGIVIVYHHAQGCSLNLTRVTRYPAHTRRSVKLGKGSLRAAFPLVACKSWLGIWKDLCDILHPKALYKPHLSHRSMPPNCQVTGLDFCSLCRICFLWAKLPNPPISGATDLNAGYFTLLINHSPPIFPNTQDPCVAALPHAEHPCIEPCLNRRLTIWCLPTSVISHRPTELLADAQVLLMVELGPSAATSLALKIKTQLKPTRGKPSAAQGPVCFCSSSGNTRYADCKLLHVGRASWFLSTNPLCPPSRRLQP